MKDFTVTISLLKYFENGGVLKKGMNLLVIDHYPCEFISKIIKNYRRYKEDKPIKLMHYKVKMINNSLYPNNKIIDCFDTELKIMLLVKYVDETRISRS